MKFLCLVYNDPSLDALQSRAESHAGIREHLAYDDTLRAGGNFVDASALEPANIGKIVRVRDGKIASTDGPFAETKEQLGGFIVIEAKDLAEAVRLAAGIPSARYGYIEVRPFHDLHAELARER